MTAIAPLRRGACPGLATPMSTGDGLLARLRPDGTLTLDQLAGLCAAARRHGNGIVEITSRGSIQVRGLDASSAPAFADAVAALVIAAHDGVPVIADPLAGLDPDELIDAGALAAGLRAALAGAPLAQRLGAKVCVAIDGGGALHLDTLTADIRLRAVASPAGPRLHVAVGGDAASAAPFGTVAPADAAETVIRLLGRIAAHGPQARGRDVVQTTTADAAGPAPRPAADPIRIHRLRDGTMAIGIGFAFGHAEAAVLDDLVRAAHEAGATGLRAAPGRALLVLGVTADRLAALVRTARVLGFVVDHDDPRRRVVACAGAPVCAAGEIPARALAPQVAADVAPLLAADEMIHISGCPKGCAHRGAAALTAIGRAGASDLLVGGTAAGSCAAAQLAQRLAVLAVSRSGRHG